jgi:hypothetical protein
MVPSPTGHSGPRAQSRAAQVAAKESARAQTQLQHMAVRIVLVVRMNLGHATLTIAQVRDHTLSRLILELLPFITCNCPVHNFSYNGQSQ